MKLLKLLIIATVFIGITSYTANTTQNTYIKIPVQQDSLKESMIRGEEIYVDFCMQCHLAAGEGVPNSFPPLAKSDWLAQKRTESIHAIKYGLKGTIQVNGKSYNNVMTSLGLEDEEIADVMNYIMNHWGNTQKKIVTPEEVAAIKK